eukprot:CAMPEP_0181196210 /NCGR_PEP_ID=MMETSP1096-20121128/15329_1 /TAXON_ID=156174 ORGANISM="Chrysochromulina ericina, Strain CCMP281" /NCGR_SAMPLE_ID=MMETSP1096 /ASSEMBLY_ACC=CAM_ASM_000453 /LENGTH=310 /DNA_ID=CAMNT_0023285925 /DNA_START=180 /DNA_END=1112 /DNA_ORIENTATION=+
MVDKLIDQSFAASFSATVLHDSPINFTEYRGVELRRLTDRTASVVDRLPSIDGRWVAYERELLRHDGGPADNDCVFAIDLSDVRLIADAAMLCATHPSSLFVGSDSCTTRPVKRWLNGLIPSAGFNASTRMREWMRTFSPVYNPGIVGGRFALLRPFLHQMAASIEAHYTARPPRPLPASLPADRRSRQLNNSLFFVDMLYFNELLLRRNGTAESETSSSALMIGYPHGPVNAPMWGNLCRDHNCTPETNNFAGFGNYDCCMYARQRAFVESGQYYFTHKQLRLSWEMALETRSDDNMRARYLGLQRAGG